MRSKTWLHFVKIDSNTVKCNRCLAIIKCKSGNTSNMMKHLIIHGINLRLDNCTVFNTPSAGSSASADEITGPSVQASSSVAGSTPSLTPFTMAASHNKLRKEKRDEFHRAVTRFIVKGLHPFNTVESPSFRSSTQIKVLPGGLPRIRTVVVWLKRAVLAKTSPQREATPPKLLSTGLVLDVKTRWNTLFLMVGKVH
ncbi:unnamed protein product [Boreogadus saida]